MDFLLPEWLLALTLTLFVLDIFLATEVLSWGGILSLAIYFTWRIEPSWKWTILVFVLSLVVSILLYYTILYGLVFRAIRSLLQHGAPDELNERLCNAEGTIHYVGEKAMFKWNGDELWSISNEAPLSEGTRVKVISIKDNVLTVATIN